MDDTVTLPVRIAEMFGFLVPFAVASLLIGFIAGIAWTWAAGIVVVIFCIGKVVERWLS